MEIGDIIYVNVVEMAHAGITAVVASYVAGRIVNDVADAYVKVPDSIKISSLCTFIMDKLVITPIVVVP